MRLWLSLAVFGLLLGPWSAQARDVASEPAYPVQEEPAAKPAPKAKAAPHLAAKPAEPNTGGGDKSAIKLPLPRPATPEVKVEAKAELPKPSKPVKFETAAAPVRADPFAKLPVNERAAIRAALLWSSGEDGKPGDGEDPMTAAIKAYQKRNKAKVTGVLTDAERDELLAAARTHHDDFGWSVVVDPATGIRLGIPGKLVPVAREARSGTRWSARHGEIVVETFRTKTTDNLNTLFEAQKKEPANRKIESSYVRSDSFFVGGLQGLKYFAVRAQLKNGELRGYTIFYDQAMEGIVLPVLPAMANAFAPFPEGIAPVATLSRPVAYGTGVIVSEDGHIVTDRRFADGCDVITIPGVGNAERVAIDEAKGLGLLRVYGKSKLKAAVLADSAMPRDIKLIGIAEPNSQNGNARRSTIAAQLTDGNGLQPREAAPLGGFSGAPALDPQGRVLGIVEMHGVQLASAQPIAPPVRLVPAAAIRSFLAANNVGLAANNGGETSIVRVICTRH